MRSSEQNSGPTLLLHWFTVPMDPPIHQPTAPPAHPPIHLPCISSSYSNQLAKEAACDNSPETTYHKHPKSAVTSKLKCLGLQKWQSEWDNTNKGALTKTFFPTIKDRLTKRLQMNLNLSTVVTGHGKLRSYLCRFKITDDPTCPCQMGPQSTEHLIRECTILNKGILLKTKLQMREGDGHCLTVS